MSKNYDAATVVPAEGARVALLTCLRCGAVVMADSRGAEGPQIHDRWHSEWHQDNEALLKDNERLKEIIWPVPAKRP